ncbi:GTP-binding protein RAD [Eufriesea mexicana]|uniref:GTP-binding protein RAD n=1 Tax=Eufriesea mexicana TaxID=516756 RepID=A0A310ST19_9HYME|nr:GTP-binding protein RAD [Eufriesea mexicana]
MKLLVSTRGPCWAVAGQDRHFASQPHGVELNHPCGLTVDGTSPSASMCPSPSRVRLRQRTAPSRSEDALIRGGHPGTRCMTRLTVTGNECRRRVSRYEGPAGPCKPDRHFASQPHGVELNHPCGLTVDTMPVQLQAHAPVAYDQGAGPPHRVQKKQRPEGLPGTRCMTRLTVAGNECRRRVLCQVSATESFYSTDDEFGEKTVSILLDGEESEMVFIDHPHVEMSVENSLSTYEPHACIVVYSIVSRTSFQVAEEMLNYLWREHHTQERSVIVVGNKSDLARSRTVTANEGKQLATLRECKFIETSSGIQHNVDELLVGVLKQIRLRESRDKKLKRQGSKRKILSKLHGSKTALSLNLAREILHKMCLNDSKSKSCENLHVL